MVAEGVTAQTAEAAVIADFNSQLATHIAQFETNNTGVRLLDLIQLIPVSLLKYRKRLQVTTWLWDSNAAFTLVLDNPTAFGFVDAVSYGGTGDFWG